MYRYPQEVYLFNGIKKDIVCFVANDRIANKIKQMTKDQEDCQNI